MWPFKRGGMVRPGVHHYVGTGELEGRRIHLRVDGPDRGILIMDASRMLILNRTGVEFSHLILKGMNDRQIIRKLLGRYRVKKKVLEEDLAAFKKEFFSLLTSTEIVTNMEDDLSKLYEGQRAPYRMDLALTYRCNNECIHCYNERRESRELSTREWKKVLERLWKLGIPHIVFTGGEPTMREDLPELISYAESLGQITGMNTNGRKLKDREYLEKLMSSGLDHVQITLESIDERVHDKITGRKGSFRETIEGIRNCVGSGIYLVTNTTIMEENEAAVPDTIRALRDMGVGHIAVNSIIRSGKGENARGIPPERLGKLLETGRDMGLESGFEFRWYSPTPYCVLNPMELGLGMKQCTACRLNMAVEPDGNVIPCQSYYESLGNILKDPWKKIWESDLCRKIRNREALPEKCASCDLVEVCAGGCPLSWDRDDYICRNVLSS